MKNATPPWHVGKVLSKSQAKKAIKDAMRKESLPKDINPSSFNAWAKRNGIPEVTIHDLYDIGGVDALMNSAGACNSTNPVVRKAMNAVANGK